MTRKFALGLTMLVAAAIGVLAPGATAASPDGAGGWEDAVADHATGVTSSGRQVEADRRDPEAAIGIAEGSFEPRHFFSMGVGGRIVLSFDNGVCNGPGADLRLVEATREPYPDELVDVSVSADGRTFSTLARGVSKDADVAFPAGVSSVRFVGLVDATDPKSTTSADGYDLDGVMALHTSGCAAPPAPAAPSGSVSGGTSGDTSQPSSAGSMGDAASEAAGTTAGFTLVDRLSGRSRSTCRVPSGLRGRTVATARRRIRRGNCRTGRVVPVRSRKYRKGRVVRVSPRPGASRPWRSRVTLYVSRGWR